MYYALYGKMKKKVLTVVSSERRDYEIIGKWGLIFVFFMLLITKKN